MSQEGGLQNRTEDARSLLIAWGVPDGHEQAERERYDHSAGWEAAERPVTEVSN